MVVPFGMLATTGVSADTAKTVYLSDAGDDANDGSTAAKAVKTMAKAYELLNAGGTIVISGTYTQSAHFFGCDIAHTGKITIKGADANALWEVVGDCRFFLGGVTEITDIKIKNASKTFYFICNFNDFTVTETVTVERVKDFLINAGGQNGQQAQDRVYVPKDVTVTINGGSWVDVIGFTRSGGYPLGATAFSADFFKGTDVTFNIGGKASIDKLYGFSRSASGAAQVFEGASCTVNLNGGVINKFICMHDINSIRTGIDGGMNVNINKGCDFDKYFKANVTLDENFYWKDGSNDRYVFYGLNGCTAWDDNKVAAMGGFIGKSKLVIADELYESLKDHERIRTESFASIEKAGAQTPDQPGETPDTGDMTWVVAVVAAVAVMGSAVVLKKREN